MNMFVYFHTNTETKTKKMPADGGLEIQSTLLAAAFLTNSCLCCPHKLFSLMFKSVMVTNVLCAVVQNASMEFIELMVSMR